MTLSLSLLMGCTEPAEQAVLSDDTAAVPDTTPAVVWPALRINEFMASNRSVLADGTGTYSDWLELFNPTDEVVDLGGWSLTDDLDSPDTAILDDALSIEPGGFLLLWADEEPALGPDHLGFRLSEAGEQLGLFAPDGALVDGMHFAEQAADLSAARLPDGSTSWVLSAQPTPGASNEE